MSFLHLLLFSRPANKEELFNLRHASARNVIERIFSDIKRRFRILLLPPEYSIEVQSLIPVALCVLHNIIKSHSDSEDIDDDYITRDWTISVERGDGVTEHTGDGEIGGEEGGEEEEEDEDEDSVGSRALRDSIAEAMWNDYQTLTDARFTVI